MYDELIAFIGLIIYELDEKLYKESQLYDDYLFEDKRSQFSKIQNKLKKIQVCLEKNQLQDFSFFEAWINEYKEHTKTLPYGHCFIAKSICNRFNNPFIDTLKIFLDHLGHYINNNIYFREEPYL